MSKETVALQFDMFLQDYVDNRSAGQKRKDRERQKLQQASLFSIHDMAQMTANARPWLNQMPQPPLELEIQEVRTEEEIERDRRREAQALTASMFEHPPDTPTSPEPEQDLKPDRPEGDNPTALLLVSKAAMVAARPDLKSQIDGLSEVEIQTIAREMEEALRPVYGLLLNATLTTFCAQKAGAAKATEPAPRASSAIARNSVSHPETNEPTYVPIPIPNTSATLPVMIY